MSCSILKPRANGVARTDGWLGGACRRWQVDDGRDKQNMRHEGTGERNRRAQVTSGKCRNTVRRTAQWHHLWKALGEAAHPWGGGRGGGVAEPWGKLGGSAEEWEVERGHGVSAWEERWRMDGGELLICFLNRREMQLNHKVGATKQNRYWLLSSITSPLIRWHEFTSA
jgi:hypothetical protein